MAKVGAKRASELTGKSKSTIQRAMKTGKVSFEIDGAGRRMIDVSELERVYGLVSKTEKTSKETNTQDTQSGQDVSKAEMELMKARHTLEVERLNLQNKMLMEQLNQTQDIVSDLKAQRDQWQKQAQQVLLTSQYSQKQSEERIAELREREEQRMRRAMQQQKQKMQSQQQSAQNAQTVAGQKPAVKTVRADNQNFRSKEALKAQGQSEKSGLLSRFFSGKKKSA